MNWHEIAEEIGGEPIERFGMAHGVVIREERCTVTVREKTFGGFEAKREENGSTWRTGWGDTPAEALADLGPEPEPQTVESYLAVEKPSMVRGPKPDCPECGEPLSFYDDRGHWERHWGLRCECGFEVDVKDASRLRAANERMTPKERGRHRATDLYGDHIHYMDTDDGTTG